MAIGDRVRANRRALSRLFLLRIADTGLSQYFCDFKFTVYLIASLTDHRNEFGTRALHGEGLGVLHPVLTQCDYIGDAIDDQADSDPLASCYDYTALAMKLRLLNAVHSPEIDSRQ